MTTINMHMKFEIEIPKQTWLTSRKPCHLQSPETEKSNMLKVTSLKINRLLPMAIINMHMEFEIEIPKQTWLTLRKPCRLQRDGRTDKVNPVYPPSNFVGRGIKTETSLSGLSPVSDMEVYVDLNHVSKLLPAVLDRVAEINRLEDFQGLLNSITQTCMVCCHCLLPGSLYVLGEFGSLSSHLKLFVWDI